MSVVQELIKSLDLPKDIRKMTIVFEHGRPPILHIESYAMEDSKLTPLLEFSKYELTKQFKQ